MKRLLLVAVMVLVSLVGMVGFSLAGNAVSALQATAKATNGAVTELPGTVNAGDEYRTYYDPKEAFIDLPGTVNAGDEYRAYYDPKEAFIDLPGTVNAGDGYPAYYDPKEAFIDLPGTVNAGLLAKPKMYYLTVTGFAGGDAITACDSGFHMASISEIQDPSNLQYATRSTTRSTTVYDSIVALVDSPPLTGSTTGRTPADDSTYEFVPFDQAPDQFTYEFVPFDQASDQFPDHTGWVRTEADSLTGLVNNCDVWMSSSDQQSGTTMTRRSLWGENNGHSLYEESDPAAWWQSTQTASCSQPEPVWCVEDHPVMRSAICTGTIDQQSGDCS